MHVLYVTSSSFSGSTLLAFLLNTHPEIFTVSEMEGWMYREKAFPCSCGETIESCPFFRYMAQTYGRAGLRWDPRNFGTAYRLTDDERLNRYLTGQIPLLAYTNVERTRDVVLRSIPYFANTIRAANRANVTFIKGALEFARARIFVDATKNPYRLRYLQRIPELSLRVLYLVRDFRGVAHSMMKNHGMSADIAVRVWMRDQLNILRVAREASPSVSVYYEDLCERTNEELIRLHRFLGLEPVPYCGDFRGAEHHILGNSMRLAQSGQIAKNTSWATELSPSQLDVIQTIPAHFVRRHPRHPLSEIVRHYLQGRRTG